VWSSPDNLGVASNWPTGLLATEDFQRTVAGAMGASIGFERPVEWVLSVRTEEDKIDRLVLISPYEADNLLGDVQSNKSVAPIASLPEQISQSLL
jgi:hypothetical protein